MNYTKGKWKVEEDGVIVAEDARQIASVFPRDREANAQLIAAAPDLYEALKGMLENSELDPFSGRAWVRACPSNDAIVKAFEALAKAEEK